MTANDAYRKKMETRLEAIDAEMDRLKAEARSKDADAQLEYAESLSHLKARRAEFERRMDKLRQAGEAVLGDIQAGVENAWKDLDAAMERARARFR
ncbi:coiled coil domain-containing protein [Minwuia thermotolerans]|nr:coiled coil domain-containing protein [Minwuia thermotolerans]